MLPILKIRLTELLRQMPFLTRKIMKKTALRKLCRLTDIRLL